jgi:4-amino-4-deoxychorismate lyase
MRPKLLIDGTPSASTWPYERSCQYGDGLFETIAVIEGSPCLWEAHVRRLLLGCERLRLPVPDVDELKSQALSLCHDYPRAVLKLAWSAGGRQRGYRRAQGAIPRSVMSIDQWQPPEKNNGWRVRVCDQRLGSNPYLAGIKHMNRLEQVLGRLECDDTLFDEGIMCSQDDHLVGGTMSNLFLQQGDKLLTPRIATAGIAGVVRDLLISNARRQGDDVEIADLAVSELYRSDALYLSNALLGIVRVSQCGDHLYDPSIAEHPLVVAARKECHRPGISP